VAQFVSGDVAVQQSHERTIVTIEKYIEELIRLRQQFGADLEVYRSNASDSTTMRKAGLPRMHHLKKDSNVFRFRDGVDPDRLRGARVVLL
jgi:hypothetical protein